MGCWLEKKNALVWYKKKNKTPKAAIPVERVNWHLLYVPSLRLSRPLWELSP